MGRQVFAKSTFVDYNWVKACFKAQHQVDNKKYILFKLFTPPSKDEHGCFLDSPSEMLRSLQERPTQIHNYSRKVQLELQKDFLLDVKTTLFHHKRHGGLLDFCSYSSPY